MELGYILPIIGNAISSRQFLSSEALAPVNNKNNEEINVCSFDFYSIACDESTDASDTTQLLI